MNKPTVSIIIPTYNRAELLKKAIDSVLNQTYENIIEIIITDDGSTDSTKEVVKECQKKDPRIIYAINTKYTHGPTGNKNNGLDLAKGEFIGILDDDDILLPNAVEDLIDVYLKYGYKIIFANCLRSDNNEFSGKHYGKSEEVSYRDMICGHFEGEYWGIFHRDLLGEKRFNPKTWGGESLLWWDIFEKQSGYYLHKAVRIYNVDPHESVVGQYFKKPERSFLNYKLSLEKYGNDFLKYCPWRFTKISLLAAIFAKLKGDYFLALKYWLLSFKSKKGLLIKMITFFYFLLPLPYKVQIFLLVIIKKLKLLFKL